MARPKTNESRASRAAAAAAAQQAAERRRRNINVAAVLISLTVILIGGFFFSRSLDTTDDVKASAPSATSAVGVTIGEDDAPNSVVIYEDFLCPFCAELESQTRGDLERLADAGKVQVEYRPFDLLGGGDPESYSVRSAAAFSVVLETDSADVAKKFHDLLFENQPSESGPFPSNADLADLAADAGADSDAVLEGLESGDGLDWVTNATDEASQSGVQSTPTIILNGKPYSDGRTVDDLASNLVATLE